MRWYVGVVTLLLIALPSCRNSDRNTDSAVLADSKTLQGMIPALEASQSLAVVSSPASEADGEPTTAETIGVWSAADLPATPDAMYAAFDTGDGYARFPADGYLEDYYGTQGQLAYLELRETSDGWGEYQASLYVLPTFSTTIWRSLELYRLNGTTWDSLVEGPSGQLFENLRTDNFDGSQENRDLIWARNWVDAAGSQVFVTSYFDIPEDFSDDAFDYPDAVTSPTTTAVSLLDGDSYASHTEGETSFADTENRSEDIIEFYNQLPDPINGGHLKYSKMFKEFAAVEEQWGSNAESVRISYEEGDGTTVVRSKRIWTYTKNGTVERDRPYETEETEITVLPDGSTEYFRETRTYRKENHSGQAYQSRTELELTETAPDSDEHVGEMRYYEKKKLQGVYDATLDPSRGLRLQSRDGKAIASFDVGSVIHFSDSPQSPTIHVIDMDHGGTFVGGLSGGKLVGTYTDIFGRTSDLSVSLTSVVVDGKLFLPAGDPDDDDD